MIYVKYPRTYHLPFSLGIINDDKVLDSMDFFKNKEVVVTEKLDGENTNMYSDYIHVRSLTSCDHVSQHWVKGLHSIIKNDIPKGWRICGENLFAKHSVFYDKLESYFYVFSIWNDKHECLSWADTEIWAEMLNLKTVPVLYKGLWDENKIKQCYTGKSQLGDVQEGYVVRIADRFNYMEFDKCVAKFVRKNHVQTNEHWKLGQIETNQLISKK
jgi:hypothetical protein